MNNSDVRSTSKEHEPNLTSYMCRKTRLRAHRWLFAWGWYFYCGRSMVEIRRSWQTGDSLSSHSESHRNQDSSGSGRQSYCLSPGKKALPLKQMLCCLCTASENISTLFPAIVQQIPAPHHQRRISSPLAI